MSGGYLNTWLQQLGARIQQQDGHACAELIKQIETRTSLNQQVQDVNHLTTLCNRSIIQPYNQIVLLYIRSLQSSSDIETSFSLALQSCDRLYSAMEAEKESNWSLPLIEELLKQLRLKSYAADSVQKSSTTVAANANPGVSNKPNHRIQVQDLLKRFLQKMVVDRSSPEYSKKQGCVFIMNHLFKIYFQLNNLKMCTYLIKMMKSLPPLSTYPMAHQVTYQFYCARLNLFEENYAQAKESFMFSFLSCPNEAVQNKRKILFYLIPLTLLEGRFPSKQLLIKYQLVDEFAPLIRSITSGDLRLFASHLNTYQNEFINKGVLLLIEKLKMQVYRNLFQILYQRIHLPNAPAQTANQLPLSLLKSGILAQGGSVNDDELECILATMIYRQQMKGYIAHQRCVVLSKADPFPSLSKIAT